MVESDLISKLDKKEYENYELKKLLTEMRQQMNVKTDAINKAQQIIEQFTEKGDQDESQIQELSVEIDRAQKEVTRKHKELHEVKQQLHVLSQKQQEKDAKLNEHLNTELQELKEALKAYQDELQQEKRNYHCAMEDSQIEKDRL